MPFGAAAGNITVSGAATLNLFGNTLNVNGLFGSGTIDNSSVASPTLVVGNNNTSSSFAGVIQNTRGSVALEFLGNGTLYLTNTANSYAGGTTLNGGVLNIAGDGAFGASAGGVDFAGNSTLQFAAPTTLGAARALSIGLERDGHARHAGQSRDGRRRDRRPRQPFRAGQRPAYAHQRLEQPRRHARAIGQQQPDDRGPDVLRALRRSRATATC